ncbi:MAG TPA: retropepsin-like aspartic protease [Steroidobacteraceae bacterium]|nr:retropepsin-like aspartic protease [Steroidobacteraceae bacterium]
MPVISSLRDVWGAAPRARLLSIVGLTALLAAAGAAAAATTQEISPPAAASEEPLASPTTLDHIGRVVVAVMVNGQGPFHFIVDTGARRSTVSPALVRALGLKPADAPFILLDGITGSAQVAAVTIDTLQAGALTLSRTSMPVVWAPVMAGADGILGTAGLTDQSLLVDFQHNRVMISSAVEAAVRADSMRVHALRLTDGLLTLDTHVGAVRVRAVLDTGSARTLGNLALRDAVQMRRTAGVMARVTSVYGATKQVEPGEVFRAPVIAIDALRVTDVEIVYGNFHIFEVWGMQDKPAMIIGMDILGTVASLGIDFKNQDVYVGSPRASGDPLSSVRSSTAGRESR